MTIAIKGTVYQKTVTATADGPFQLDNDPNIFLVSANIHVYDQDADYGNVSGQPASIKTNAVVWFDGVQRVCDYWFKNHTAGSNTRVAIVGILAQG